jgi:hypothetical protein
MGFDRFWHKADVILTPGYVRFRLGADICISLRKSKNKENIK